MARLRIPTTRRLVAWATLILLGLGAIIGGLTASSGRASAASTKLYDLMSDGTMSVTSNTNRYAQSFTTSSSATSLVSVKVWVRNNGGSPTSFSLGLYSSSSGVPGTQLQSIVTNSSLVAWGDEKPVFTLSTPYSLAASTTYFIVMSGPAGGAAGWKCNATAPTTDVSPTPTFSAKQTTDSGSTWSAVSGGCAGQNYNMTVTGAIPAAPSLGTFANVDVDYGAASQTITAPTANTPGSFSYSSSNTSVATVSGSTLSFTGVGTSTITADFTPTDTTNWTTASTTMTVTVAKGTPTLGTFSAVDATFGDSAQTITAPGADTAGSFNYTSSDTSVATIAGTTITFVGAGTSTITADFTPTDTANWNTASTTMTATVAKGTPALGTFGAVNATVGDAPQTITAPSADTAGSFNYTSSDTSVATIAGTTITFVGAGTSTITADFTPTDTANWNTASTTMTATVAGPTPTTTTTTTTVPAQPATTTTTQPAIVSPPASTNTTTTTTVPPAPAGDFPPPTPREPSNDIFGDSEGEQMAVTIDTRIGERAAGAPVRISAVALAPNSQVTVTVFSDPQVLLTGAADANGTFEGSVVLPELEPGRHTVLVESTGTNGEIQVAGALLLDDEGFVDRLAQPAVLTDFTGPDDSRLTRALTHDRPVWDVAARPLTTAAITVSAVGLLAFAGAAGLSTARTTAPSGGLATGDAGAAAATTASGDGERRRRSRARLASVVTKKLKGIQIDSSHRGDTSGTWGMPGTAATDSFSRTAPLRVGPWSASVPRILVDGAWARAMFGSFGFALWPLGVLTAILASTTGGSTAVVPAFGFLLIMVIIGILDAGAGACAWLTLVLFSVIGGQIEGWPDVRALMGLGILLSTISLLAHVIRPLRRYVATNRSETWERVFDYVMMPVFVAFASGAMLKALNGLSGLQIVSAGQIADLRWAVYFTVIARLAVEDVAAHLYPERMRIVQPEKLASQRRPAAGVAIVVRSVVFLFIAEPFFGLTATTVLAAFLLAFPMVLKLWEDDLPNSATLNKWFPRGLFRFLCLTLLGMYLTATFIGRDGGDAAVKSSFIWLLLPGVSEGVIELFGRHGGNWPNVMVKRTLGAVVWVTAVSVVTGLYTPFI